MATIFHSENFENAIDNVDFDWEESFIEEDGLWDYDDLADIDFNEDVSFNGELDY